jgi:radical SAM protein with 4Fe4S-binding SPASM domain
MIAYAAERGIHTKLHTNAVRLDEERSRNLLDSGLDLLSFSFDGYTKETYERIRVGADFEQVVRNIIGFLEMKRRLSRQKPFTMIEMIDLPGIGLGGERSQRRRFEERFRNLPLDRIAVKKPHNWAGIHAFSRQEGPPPKKLTRCLFPWFALVVLWDGEVLPCPQDFLAELSIGNVNESSLMEIWNGERMVRLRRGLLRGDFLRLAPCGDCDMLQRRRLLGIPLSASQAVLRRARRASR